MDAFIPEIITLYNLINLIAKWSTVYFLLFAYMASISVNLDFYGVISQEGGLITQVGNYLLVSRSIEIIVKVVKI